ncbi:protein NDR1-like [Papaver somniferum]|uniref:protein NDR1-like n=1 Tax=Papaver somniferum TaxID=3469 RepID=UPI000E6F68D6|nr:protein NDR1-like [Papaver somniferum]
MCKTKNVYLWILQLVIFSTLLALVLWISLRPKNPTYTIVAFSINPTSSSTDIAQQNTTSSESSSNGTAIVSLNLEIENPNDDSSIYYDNVNVTVYYGEEEVGGTEIPSFHQGKGESHQFAKTVRTRGKILQAISNRTAEFRVGLITRIRFKTSGLKTKRNRMDLQGHVQVGSDGKISKKKKKVRLHRAARSRKFADFLRG